MTILWILCIIVTASSVTGEEDLEIKLNGKQTLQLKLENDKVKSNRDFELTLLFKTIHPSGVIFWARGKTGENVLIEMIRGKLRIVLGRRQNFTSGNYEEILLNDNLCDNKWHQLEVKILQETTYAKVDTTDPFISKTKQRRYFDDIVTIGGYPLPNKYLPTASGNNYDGCLNYVILNDVDILQGLYKQNKQLKWSCDDNEKFDIINFNRKDTYIPFTNPSVTFIDIGLSFRTYYRDGVLITNENDNQPTVKHASENIMGFTLYFEGNVVKLRILGLTVITIRPKEDIDFGSWQRLHLRIHRGLATLAVGSNTKTTLLKNKGDYNFGKSLFFGKRKNSTSVFRGWLWKITINGRRMSIMNATQASSIIYQMKDHCYPNPCKNGGRCIQTNNGSLCNCSGTGFDDSICSSRSSEYKRTCKEYYSSGKRVNGFYKVFPGTKIFMVYCKMDDPKGPVTTIKPRQGTQLKALYETSKSDNDFYYHDIEYSAGKQEVEDLVQLSGQCRQYLEFSCSSSTLMFSQDKENGLVNRYGGRWFSKDDIIQNYWGGGTKNGFNCACGVSGNCVDPELNCNCDSMDKEWRSDAGYLTDKTDLPVSKLQFSKKYTMPSAMYRIGALECYGDPVQTTKLSSLTTLASTQSPMNAPSSPREKKSSSSNHQTETTRSTIVISRTVNSTKHSSIPPSLVVSSTLTTSKSSNNGIKNDTNNSFHTARFSTAYAQNGEKLSAKVATKVKDALKSTSRSLLDTSSDRSNSTIGNKQTLILIALISGLTLITLFLIFAVIRQRLFRPSKKLTIELKQDPEDGNSYSVRQPNNNQRSPTDDDRQYRSTSDVNRIEIIRVSSPFRKPLASESEGSLSSFDTSRYLEVGEESDSGSTSSFTKPKGILKSKNQFVMSKRPRSEGDSFESDNPKEIIGLIHISNDNSHSKSDEQTSLLSDSKSDVSPYAQFHLHPKTFNTVVQINNKNNRLSHSDRESIDADAGFITDSSSSCDSRKSLSSSGSEEGNDECYTAKKLRSKRCVRFSIQELTHSTTIRAENDIYSKVCHSEGDDEVFS